MNQLLSGILDEKGHDVLRIDADASVFDAVKRMVEANVGSLLVTESGEITGIVTERDYLRRAALEGRTDEETAVREIMSSPLLVATPETTVDECMALMTDRRIRHVPVVDGARLDHRKLTRCEGFWARRRTERANAVARAGSG